MSMYAAATASTLSRSFCAAPYTALPASVVPRLAYVPPPKGVRSVLPWYTVTLSSGTPSPSAQICAKMVSCPCPIVAMPR